MSSNCYTAACALLVVVSRAPVTQAQPVQADARFGACAVALGAAVLGPELAGTASLGLIVPLTDRVAFALPVVVDVELLARDDALLWAFAGVTGFGIVWTHATGSGIDVTQWVLQPAGGFEALLDLGGRVSLAASVGIDVPVVRTDDRVSASVDGAIRLAPTVSVGRWDLAVGLAFGRALDRGHDTVYGVGSTVFELGGFGNTASVGHVPLPTVRYRIGERWGLDLHAGMLRGDRRVESVLLGFSFRW